MPGSVLNTGHAKRRMRTLLSSSIRCKMESRQKITVISILCDQHSRHIVQMLLWGLAKVERWVGLAQYTGSRWEQSLGKCRLPLRMKCEKWKLNDLGPNPWYCPMPEQKNHGFQRNMKEISHWEQQSNRWMCESRFSEMPEIQSREAIWKGRTN